MTTETQAPDPGADDMLEPLIYAAIMHNGKPKTVAEFERAAANVADMLQRRAEVTHNKPVASIYISDDGSREFDDWRVDLPPGNHQLFTAPRPDQPQPESLPHPGAPEAEEMIEKLLAECNRPSNMKNAARAGYMAARRLLQHSRQPLPAVETESNLYLRLESLSKRLESSGRIDEHDTPDAYATILDAMNAALAVPATLSNVQPKGMPAGMVLVPAEPTKEMNRAGFYAHQATGLTGEIWRAMLAAAPAVQAPAPAHPHLTPRLVAVLKEALRDGWHDEHGEPLKDDLEIALGLRAAPCAAVTHGWRPIETAPKDGTAILAFWKPIGSGPIPSCYGITQFVEGRWRNPDEDDDYFIDPTHWTPLPAAPELYVPVQRSES